MEKKEPKQTPEPTYEEQPAAQEASATFYDPVSDDAITAALASMATAMASLVDPAEAAVLTEAAATLMEGGEDGNA